MPCLQPNLNPTSANSTSEDATPTNPTGVGSRVLIVSDAPETIPQLKGANSLPLVVGSESITSPSGLGNNPATTYTLYKCEVPLLTTSKDFRVFLNHASRFSSDTTIVIAVSVDQAASASISDMRADTISNVDSGGGCLAKAQYYQTLQSRSPDNSSIFGGIEAQIWHVTLPAGGFVGAVVEFTLNVAVPIGNARIRVLVSGGGLAGSWGDGVAWPWHYSRTTADGDQFAMHVRGWWPYCQASFAAASLDVNPHPLGSPPPLAFTTVCRDSGIEVSAQAFGKQASDTYGLAKGNAGAYGADLFYIFTLSNSGSQSFPADLSMSCRNTGRPWYGVAHIEIPNVYLKAGVPAIQSPIAMCQINVDLLNSYTPITVGAGETKQVKVGIVNASGSTLPINILVRAGVGTNPTQPPDQ